MQFKSWTELAARERLADCVVIATQVRSTGRGPPARPVVRPHTQIPQDSMHADPAVAFAGKGCGRDPAWKALHALSCPASPPPRPDPTPPRSYHILLEKPMANTEAECHRIYKAVTQAGVIFAVCHVLRYTPCAFIRLVWRPSPPPHCP